MSDFRYETENGFITVRPSIKVGKIYVWIHEGRKNAEILIPANEGPAVAAELLKAAGHDGVIVPKAYEEVGRNGGEITCGSGPEKAYGAVSQNPNWLYNKAANYVALAQWIEGAADREAAEKAEAEAAEKKLQERRDAITAELDGGADYDEFHPTSPFRKAIDRIIELEDKAATP